MSEKIPEPKYKKVLTKKQYINNKVVITGREKWVNSETGEVAEALTGLARVEDINFTKVWITHLLNALDLIGSKKMKVVNYILDNINYSDNMLVITQDELSEKTGVSRKTVNETIALLKQADFLRNKVGVIMLNPDIIAKGSAQKRDYLLIKFQSFNQNDNEKK